MKNLTVKSFSKRILIYFAWLFISNIAIVFITGFFLFIGKTELFIVGKNKYSSKNDIYIMGNSHPETAINDIFLSGKMINISESAEPLFYTVIKARTLLFNNELDTVVIEFTNNSLHTVKWVLSDERLLRNYRKHFLKLSLGEHFLLHKENLPKALKTFFSMSPFDLYNSKININGKYCEPVFNELDRNKVQLNSLNNLKLNKVIYDSDLESLGFEMLNELIKTNPNTFFISTRMPLHKSYLDLKNEQTYLECISELTRNKNFKFIDFKNTPLEDLEFADAEHLNFKGAKKFTLIFRDSLLF
jgi:hypothetical protein